MTDIIDVENKIRTEDFRTTLEEMLGKYETVRLDDCKGCGNPWFFKMHDRVRCTTCGLDLKTELTPPNPPFKQIWLRDVDWLDETPERNVEEYMPVYVIKPEDHAQLAQEVQDLYALLLDVFSQGTRGADGKYDHQCLSAYEHAQSYLIENGLIKDEDCSRKA